MHQPSTLAACSAAHPTRSRVGVGVRRSGRQDPDNTVITESIDMITLR